MTNCKKFVKIERCQEVDFPINPNSSFIKNVRVRYEGAGRFNVSVLISSSGQLRRYEHRHIQAKWLREYKAGDSVGKWYNSYIKR